MEVAELRNLDEKNRRALMLAPVYVSALIAGADGKVDKKELAKAINTIQAKQKQSRPALQDFYAAVGKTFEEDLLHLLNQLPADQKEREKQIVGFLEDTSWALGKVDKEFGKQLYFSLKEVAKKIAESSGGIFGYLSVGYEESRFVDLKMIKDPAA